MNYSIPLSSNQTDIWIDQNNYPNHPIYNIGGTFVFYGSVDYAILNQALRCLIAENDIFRISPSPHQFDEAVLLPEIHYDLEFVDFSQDNPSDSWVWEWLETCFKKKFALKPGSFLWQFALIKQNKNRFYLLTKYHHLIADGWTTTVVMSRLAQIYNNLLAENSIEKNDAQQFFEFVQQDQAYLDSDHYKNDAAYWKKNIPEPPLPLITKKYPLASDTLLPQSIIHRFKIQRSLYNRIDQFSKSHSSTTYHTFLAGLGIYFSCYYQKNSIAIGVPSLNRNGARFKDVCGMFVNVSPLVLDIRPEDSLKKLMRHCRQQLRELYRHHRFPLSHIGKQINLFQSGRDTLFDIIFSYEKHDYSVQFGETRIEAKQQFNGFARYPLAITICEFSEQDDIEVIFEGAETCFSPEDLTDFAEHFLLILEQIIQNQPGIIAALNLLTPKDQDLIFSKFNPSLSKESVFKSVLTQFSEQVARYPDSPALQYQQERFSYQELDQLSDRFAAYLQSISVANSMIALLMPRRPEMIIGLLAILKCGSAYLPIAVDLPKKRIQSILKQSQCDLILTLCSQEQEVNDLNTDYVLVDQWLTSPFEHHPFKPIEINHQSAYVIFTSGSTGQPKGVEVSHSALAQRLQWLQSQFLIQPQDRVAQNIAYHFDPSLIEIFLALTQGATLVLLPETYLAHHGLAQFVVQEQIHAMALVPSSLQRLLNELPPNETTHLKTVCCGGDKLPAELAQQFLDQTSSRLLNFYGPTEATIAATSWKCQIKTDSDTETLPLGLPANETAILIVDSYLRPLPTGAEGEIVILGPTLANGYLNQPFLTAQAFIDYTPLKARLYRTGDTGYLAPNGLLYFTGRQDRQVKISGYRIELDEIESVLLQNPSVKSVAVAVKNQRIYAYIQTRITDQNQTLLDALSETLREMLPIYMQPAQIIAVENLPLNSTGKIDYTTLLNTNWDEIEPPIPDSHPKSYLERQLTEIWENILKIDPIGLNQNFFALGGDSLSALNLIAAIETLSGQRLPLSFLLKNPTILQQANALKANQYRSEVRIMTPLSDGNTDITVYLVASGYGDLLRFSDLAAQLSLHCQVIMLQPDDRSASIQDIATQYAEHILNQSTASFYVAGFSIGGITALETTRLLCQQQQPPISLILLDTIYPRWPLQSPGLFRLLQCLTSLFKLGKTKINNRKLENMLNDPGIQVQHQGLQTHKIQSAPVKADLILTKGMWMFHPLLFSSWKRLFKNRLTIHSIHGLHGQIFQKPYIDELVLCLQHIFKQNPVIRK